MLDRLDDFKRITKEKGVDMSKPLLDLGNNGGDEEDPRNNDRKLIEDFLPSTK